MLQSKLYIPPLRPDLVRRTGLIDRLNRGLDPGNKVILISAPAGFGKTTLVTEWLSQLPGDEYSPAWLSLDERDNDLNLFLTYVIAALGPIAPGLDIYGEMLRSPQPPEVTAVLTAIINEIARSSGRVLLILDDYHHIGNNAIHDGLDFLVQNAIPNLRLIITSRGDLPIKVARLRARREMIELRALDLRFSSEETSDLLNRHMGLNLNPDDIVVLERRTEGWITGLQLAALALQNSPAAPDRSEFIASFSGTHRYVLDYLVEEVLARQSAETQAFLRQTAILDRLSAPLCDTLTGRDDSQLVLESLTRSNLFLLPLDDERRWYRYHHLFADLLQARGRNDPERDARHKRAAGWYQEHGFPADAFNHWLEAGAMSQAATLVETQAMALLNQGYPGTVLAWIDRLPGEIVDGRPWLVIYQAWALLLTGGALAALERLQGGPPADEPEMVGHVTAIQGYAAALLGDFAGAMELLALALDHLGPEGEGIRSVAAFAMGGIHLMAGDLVRAESAFLEAAQTGQATNNRHLAVSAWYAAASLSIAKGRLRQAEEIYHQALELCATSSGGTLPVAAQAYNGLATLAFERDKVDSAWLMLDKGEELAGRGLGPDAIVNSLLLRASFHLARGETAAAWRSWQEASRLAQGQTLGPFSTSRMVATHIEIARSRGDETTVFRLIKENELTAAEAITFPREEEGIALIHHLLDQCRFDRALAFLKSYISLARKEARDGSLVQLLALQAAAFQAQGAEEQAQESLSNALSLARAEGYVRSFLSAGPAIAGLLRTMQLDSDQVVYVRALLDAFGDFEADGTGATDQDGLVEPLTNREVEVLQLVAVGLSNQAIADELVVATGTVKAHVSRIMGKLNARNRTEAVARARELDLIP